MGTCTVDSGCRTPLNTSSLILSGFVTRPSESRNSSHLSRGRPRVTSGLEPSSTPWWTNDDTHKQLTHSVCTTETTPLSPSLSYAGDEFEARVVVGLRRQTRILKRPRVGGRLWRSKGRSEEVGDFGESTKRSGVRVLDKSLLTVGRLGEQTQKRPSIWF